MGNMNIKIRKVKSNRGRKPKFGTPIVRQISVGLDSRRELQLRAIYQYLSADVENLGEITDSDVMRRAFDKFVLTLAEEVPALKKII